MAGCSILPGGCSGDLSTLDPAGPRAGELATLFWAMIAGAAGFSVVLAVLFLIALRRRRRNPNDRTAALAPRFWTHWLGIAMPLGVLALLLAATIWVGERQFVRDASLPTIRATAEQWRWQFTAVAPDGTIGAVTSQLNIVAGEPTIIEIVSEDVIHSFWVPRLAGKMDAVPGKVNRHLIEADQPGLYLGQCAEYCGVGHDGMRFEVIVRPAEGAQ